MGQEIDRTYRLRPASLADAEAIARVHSASWRTTYVGLVPDPVVAKRTDPATRLAMWVERLELQPVAYVAEDGDGIVGFASACPMPERPQDYEPLPPFASYLQALYLLERVQRRGIGRALLAAVARDLIAAGMTSMALHVLSTNPARAFYERLGATFVRDEPAHGEPFFSCAYGFADIGALARSAGD